MKTLLTQKQCWIHQNKQNYTIQTFIHAWMNACVNNRRCAQCYILYMCNRKAVCNLFFTSALTSILAPRSLSRVTTSEWPLWAATNKAVNPFYQKEYTTKNTKFLISNQTTSSAYHHWIIMHKCKRCGHFFAIIYSNSCIIIVFAFIRNNNNSKVSGFWSELLSMLASTDRISYLEPIKYMIYKCAWHSPYLWLQQPLHYPVEILQHEDSLLEQLQRER